MSAFGTVIGANSEGMGIVAVVRILSLLSSYKVWMSKLAEIGGRTKEVNKMRKKKKTKINKRKKKKTACLPLFKTLIAKQETELKRGDVSYSPSLRINRCCKLIAIASLWISRHGGGGY